MRRRTGIIAGISFVLLLAAGVVHFAATADAGPTRDETRADYDVFDVTVSGSFRGTIKYERTEGTGHCVISPRHRTKGNSWVKGTFTTALPSRRGFRIDWVRSRGKRYLQTQDPPPAHFFLLDVTGEQKDEVTLSEGCPDQSKKTKSYPCDVVGHLSRGAIGAGSYDGIRAQIGLGPGQLPTRKTCRGFYMFSAGIAVSRPFIATRLFSKARFTIHGAGYERYKDRDSTAAGVARWKAHFCKRAKPSAKPRVCMPAKKAEKG